MAKLKELSKEAQANEIMAVEPLCRPITGAPESGGSNELKYKLFEVLY